MEVVGGKERCEEGGEKESDDGVCKCLTSLVEGDGEEDGCVDLGFLWSVMRSVRMAVVLMAFCHAIFVADF